MAMPVGRNPIRIPRLVGVHRGDAATGLASEVGVGEGVAHMSQDAEFEQDETEGRNPVRDRIKQLEAENQQYRTQLAEATAAKRELAFMKVGIDTSTPTGKLFAKAYDGDTTVEAIQQAAAEYGLIKPPSPVIANEQEQSAWSRAAASQTTGAPAPATGDVREAIRNARNAQELQAIMRQVQASQ